MKTQHDMVRKSQQRVPTNNQPRGYHGKGNNFISEQEWEQLLFNNSWIRKPLIGGRANVQ